MKELTPRQKAFADNYIECGVAEEAAVKAGYSKAYARGNAHKLVANSGICAYIKERTRPVEEKRIASGNEVMEYFSAVMRGEIKDQFGLDPSLADRTKAAVELAKRTVDIDAKNNAGADIAANIKTLADILINSKPNRSLENYE